MVAYSGLVDFTVDFICPVGFDFIVRLGVSLKNSHGPYLRVKLRITWYVLKWMFMVDDPLQPSCSV